MITEKDGKLARREIVKRLLAGHDDVPVITGLSIASYDSVAARGPDFPLTFNMHGALGGAPMMGLGFALAQPAKRSLVLMGDFDAIVGLRALATIATQMPKNLAIAVFDNSICSETGGQATATAGNSGVDLARMAAAAGWPVARSVADASEVDQAIDDLLHAEGPVYVCFKVSDINPGAVKKTRDGAWMKLRFRKALLGTE
jgi:thiamine pyrophosphate-dependent acetolactate synthase large subunit-like protein